MPGTVVLIDLSNMVHIDFAVNRTAAARSTLMRIGAIKQKFKPVDIVCCYDVGIDTFRRKLCPEYKEGRERDPVYFAQLETALKLLDLAGIRTCGLAEFEADDCIATLAHLYEKDKIIIVADDKDYRQLLESGRVVQLRRFNMDEKGNREARWFNAIPDLEEEWGIAPEQCVDFQCLVGDKTDGVIGAEGIGVKHATEYLQQYGTLAKIIEAAMNGAFTEAKRDGILDLADRLDLVKRLITLRKDVPIVFKDPVSLNPKGFVEEWQRLQFQAVDTISILLFGNYSHMTEAAKPFKWQCQLQSIGQNQWSLVDRETGRFYGRVRAATPEQTAQLLEDIRQAILKQGYYDPNATNEQETTQAAGVSS